MHDEKSLQLMIEYEHTEALNAVLKYLNEQGLKILDLDIYKYSDDDPVMHHRANLALQLYRKILTRELIDELLKINGVFAVDEMSVATALESDPNSRTSGEIRHNAGE
nr:hypothetical protein [Treponema sp.]